MVHYNPERDRYEIHGVMGPDEFHEKYPDSDEEGLRNNAYTNVMVAWISDTVRKVLDLLPKKRRVALREATGLTDNEVEKWGEMSRKMFVPFHDDGVISQFEGYEDLEELDWEAYREKYDNIQRLDRILKAEGDDPDRYKLAKQADTLMLFFLFPEEELKEIFERLDYEYDAETASKNASYYSERTSHGSTLSFIVHAHILAGIDPEASWDMFLTALESDIGDIQDGTTQEGIHMGVMAGTLDLIQRGFLGSKVREGTLYFDPKLTDRLEGLSFSMRFRGTPIDVKLGNGKLTVFVNDNEGRDHAKIGVGDEVREIKAGEGYDFDVDPG
jgi:trehalose/maltose hydrolase-like predicted phosphorylase